MTTDLVGAGISPPFAAFFILEVRPSCMPAFTDPPPPLEVEMTGLFSQYGSTASMVWLVAGVIVGALVLFFIYDAIAAAVEKLRSAARREPDFDRDRRGVAPASSLGAKISPDSNRPWSRQSPLAARFLRRVVPERRTWSEHRLNQPFDE